MELKELRKQLKEYGYKVKTKKINSLGGKRFADMYKDNDFIVGSSASAYRKEHIEKHWEAIEIYNKAKETGVTHKNEKIIL